MACNLSRSLTARGISLLILLAIIQTCSSLRYQKVLDHMEQRRDELSKHPFFAFLADGSVAPERRMQFAPYWTYFAVGGADLLDQWMRYENPKNELEERVNKFIREDDYHYNFLFHDLEKVLGYTLERYGSYEAVIRHIWSAETRAVRQLNYYWGTITEMYRDDPIVTLTTFEAVEAGLTNIFRVVYKSVYGEGGLTGLKYFGKTHVELEMSHNVTSWFVEKPEGMLEEEEKEEESLAGTEITEEQMKLYIKVADGILDRFTAMYDALFDLEVAEDSIYPEKFKVEGNPPIQDFPAGFTHRPSSCTILQG